MFVTRPSATALSSTSPRRPTRCPKWAASGTPTYEVTAKGPEFTVILNGQTTVQGFKHDQLKSGPIALQYGASIMKDKGVIKFRKVEIKPL